MSLVAQPEEFQLKRAQVSEEEGNVVPQCEFSGDDITIGLQGTGRAWRAPSRDATNCCGRHCARRSGGKFLFLNRRREGPQNTTSTARHFVKLPVMVRQQRGTTTRTTDQWGNCSIQADFGGNPETTPQVTVRQVVRLPIGRQQRGTASMEQSNQFDPGG